MALTDLTVSELVATLRPRSTSLWDVGPWRALSLRAVLACVVLGVAACASGGGGGGDDGPPPTVLIASPPAVVKGASIQLSATVVDAAPGVTWAVEGGSVYGTITADGMYTAPSTLPADPVVVRATSTADARGTATTTVRVVVGEDLKRQFNREISPSTAKVNTFSGGQRSVAIYGTTVYVVWNDDSRGDDDVYLRVSRDRGATFDAAVRINDDAALGGTSPQVYPSVGVDGSGRAVIAWLDGRNYLDATFDVYIAPVTLDVTGMAVVGANQKVALAGDSDTHDLSVALAVDRSGDAYLAWAGSSGGDTDIWMVQAARMSSGMFQFTPPVLANQYVLLGQERPAIAVDETHDILVAWHSKRPIVGQIDINWEVFWRRGHFTASGAMVWETDETQVNLVTEGDQVSPTVALVSDGTNQTAYIAWIQQVGLFGSERRKLYFASSNADLTVASNTDVMQSVDADQNFPSLVIDRGEITIAVADNRGCVPTCSADTDPLNRNRTGETDIYVVRSVDGGGTFRQVGVPLNNDDQNSKLHGLPSVAVDDFGRAYAVWTGDSISVPGMSQAFMGRAE